MRSSKLPFSTDKIHTLLLFIWTFVCFLALTYHLGEIPPYHTDENYYVESVKTMVESGDYLTPYYHGEKRFAKPILTYWLMSAAYKVFGFSLAAARFWSALLGTLCVALTYFLARRLFGIRVAWLSAAILPGFYLHFLVARWATTDMTLNFFILAACLFFVRGWQEEKNRASNYHLSYFCMALGFLTKGPPAVLIPGGIILFFLLVTRQWKMLAQLRWVSGILMILAVNAPWFAAMFLLHGQEFADHLVGAEFRDRIFHDIPFSFYFVEVLFRYYLPWSLFLISALLAYTGLVSFPASAPQGSSSWLGNIKTRVRSLFHKDSWSVLFCFIGILVPLAIFILLRVEHSRYMLPASPFIAMLLGCFFVELAKSPNRFRSLLFKIPFVLTLLLYGLAAIGMGAVVVVFHTIGPVPFAVSFLPFFLVLGVNGLVLLYFYKKEIQVVLALAIIQITTMAIVSGDAAPFFNRYPMKQFAAEILKSGNGGEKVAVYRLGRNQAKLGVLTAHVVLGIDEPEELHQFIAAAADEKVFIVMRQADWREEFGDDPLTLKATDTAWKKQKIDKETLMAFWNDGIKVSLPNYLEPLALLTNR